MHRESLQHDVIELLCDSRRHRIDLKAPSGDRSLCVYGQREVVRDLIAARVEAGLPLIFEATHVALHGVDGDAPSVKFRTDDSDQRDDCDYIEGCDGFHGVQRGAIPEGVLNLFERVYPFARLGTVAEAEPSSSEMVNANRPRGFALYSMRSAKITRLYLQCEPEEDLAAWSDARIWDELHRRLASEDGWARARGIIQKGVTPMRSFVAERIHYGRLFLAGDAVHFVPPTGTKGMNLAVADVRVLSKALAAHCGGQGDEHLRPYSDTYLRRVWRAEHDSWSMTSTLHRFRDNTPFMGRRQRSELDYVTSSEAGGRFVAENYFGLPFTDWRSTGRCAPTTRHSRCGRTAAPSADDQSARE